MAGSPYKHSSRELANEPHIDRSPRSVYALTSTPNEELDLNSTLSSGGEVVVSQRGSDPARSNHDRGSRASQGSQPSQHQQLPPMFRFLNSPPESPEGVQALLHPPLYPTVITPQRSGYPGQYTMSLPPPLNMAHSPTLPFTYPLILHVPVPPQSIRVGYPSIASYSPYPADTAQPPPSPVYVSSFRFPPPFLRLPFLSRPPRTRLSMSSRPTRPAAARRVMVESGTTSPRNNSSPIDRSSTTLAHPHRCTPHQRSNSSITRRTTRTSRHPPTRVRPRQIRPRLRRPPSCPATTAADPSSAALTIPIHRGGAPSGSCGLGTSPVTRTVMSCGAFFTATPDNSESSASSSNGHEVSAGRSGVVSIFPISRSSCAFINYETEAHLKAAIDRFNGVPMRQDPRCPRLVCRVRRKDEDLRAGVGGQRGIGLHRGWVKAKEKEKGKVVHDSMSVTSTTGMGSSNAVPSLDQSVPAFSLSSSHGDDRATRPPPYPLTSSSSAASYASTNSSLLEGHFPQRYFILKSHTQDDLELSIRTGLWATQGHNEGIIDRAFRNSKDVYLIFSVNKSGEFYGYARMAGRIGEGTGKHIAWAARSPRGGSPTAARTLGPPDVGAPSPTTTHHDPHADFLSNEHLVKNSSAPIVTPRRPPLRPRDVQSAPPALEKRPHSMNPSPAVAKEEPPELADGGEESDNKSAGVREESWGQEFKLDWLCTERLPFQRTRHIRNPWNREREVKVSRDGTELEPSVGQALLAEWHRETRN
ncbi:YT521-B-like domain-containing protein [Mycena crocata]|nr:YT521-B-like domain-containing protein [Mycena crocata]